MRKALLFFLLLIAPLRATEPSALYLTYKRDPTTSITIQWHTDKRAPTELYYRTGEKEIWQPAMGTSQKIPHVRLYVHTVELLALNPDTTYTFLLKDHPTSYTFRTLPQTLDREVRFVVGGDAYYNYNRFHKMNKTIAKLKPDFIIISGDIAYSEVSIKFLHGKNWDIHRWRTFFKTITHDFITSEGKITPILPVIGNHDIKKKKKREGTIPLLFDLIAFPHRTTTYRPIDLGNYASIILLDTGHFAKINGKQRLFLEATLHARKHLPILFAIYHVAAYPSYYSYTTSTSKAIRKHWVPLFEQFHLTAAFEHHNHTYKRTHPLLHDHPHQDGIPFLGDGSWGVPPRLPARPHERPYLATTAQINAIWLVTLSSSGTTATSIDINGHPIESLSFKK